MAKFKQIHQRFLFLKLLQFWGNVVKNYTGDCRDEDFFAVTSHFFDHDKAVELIEAAYTPFEIQELQQVRLRRNRLDLDDSMDDVFRSLWNNSGSREKCRAVLDAIRECLEAETNKAKDDDTVESRFAELRRLLKLSDIEAELLLLTYVHDQTCFCWPVAVSDRDKPLYYAMALDRSYTEVRRALSPRGTLLKFGLLDDDYDFCRRTLEGFMDGTSDEPFMRRFYCKADEQTALPWSFYGELAARDGEILKHMLSASKGPCNILLYGAPGTGKTSFAHSLARELGRTAFEIRQGDEDGRNMEAGARMVGIRMCSNNESPAESLMIIDEADEFLRGGMGGDNPFAFLLGRDRSTEKGVVNSLLDDMQIPAVWISNVPANGIDEAVRRRFDYSICFERLNHAQRVAIWRNQVAKHKLGRLVTEDKIESYAARYETSAGGISTVLANVKRMNPAKNKVDELVASLMKPHCKLMGIGEANRFLPARDYSLEGLGISGNVKPAQMVTAVRNYLDADYCAGDADKPRMNVLLYGPPGTGKTEFVKFLGKELDRKVLVVKGSDILSKWVGENEQNIARAFRRAASEHAILFFDEVDGLLQDRSGARQNWEVTQVNELLQQMENFDGVMIAATNLSERLDPATMRRFTFKLKFDYLDDEGKRLFFERMFRSTLSDAEFAELRAIRNLAPGDFRTVRQEQYYLGETVGNGDRIAALKNESALKGDKRSAGAIGFK